jgi:hypothetical protein
VPMILPVASAAEGGTIDRLPFGREIFPVSVSAVQFKSHLINGFNGFGKGTASAVA